MENKKDVVKNNVGNKPDKKVGRKSLTNDLLWERRFRVIRMVAIGISITEIAKQEGIDRDTVYEDIKAYKEVITRYKESGIDEQILSLEEVKRKAFKEFEKTKNHNDKIGYLGKINEAVKILIFLDGKYKPDNLTQVNIFQNEVVKVDNKTLEEFANYITRKKYNLLESGTN